MHGFFFRLTPPRPTFPGDASEAESAVMAEHAAYWQGLMAEGTVIALGPVADGDGAFGIGVLLAPDRQTAQRICDEDPAVRSPLGFRGDIAPMLALLTPAGRYDA